MASKREVLTWEGQEIVVTNPDKVFFPDLGLAKRDLVSYYLAVSDGALRGVSGRPMMLKRFPDGVGKEAFYQKRAPEHRPDFIETVTLAFPSGRTADEVVVRDARALAWIVNLGCVDLNPHPVRAADLEHPDELRIDLDPVPGVEFSQIIEVAQVARHVLEDFGLTGWPKTSGSRGIHIYVRIAPKWTFDEVRRAALTVAREVEHRAPTVATSKWWKEERHGVFLDYNQNAKDRTTASAYSVRPTPDARVSMPISWDDLSACNPADFTLKTVPALFKAHGDAHARIDDTCGSLERLLELALQHEKDGLGDAPWPPHFAKADREPTRAAPSRLRGQGKRTPKLPLLVIGQAKKKEDALAGLERWKARYPNVAAMLAPDDILVDAMRGRYSIWTRIRVNLKNVPEAERPPQEPPDPDYSMADEWRSPSGRKSTKARTPE